MFDKKSTSRLFRVSKIEADEKYSEDFSKLLNNFSKTLPALDSICLNNSDEKKEYVILDALREDTEKSFNDSNILFDNSKNKVYGGIAINKIIN